MGKYDILFQGEAAEPTQKQSGKYSILFEGESEQPQEQKKPELLDVMGRALTPNYATPEELAKSGNWVAAGLQQTAKDVATIPAHFFNQALMNYPRSAANTAGMQYPEEAKTLAGNIANRAAGVAGAVVSPIVKGVSTLGKGAGILTAPLRQKIIAGAVAGAAYAPNENIFAPEQRAVGAVLGAAIPGAEGAVSGIAKGLQPTLKAGAERFINSLIKPTLKQFSYGKNPGRGVAAEGIVANTMDELGQKISQARRNIGSKIQEILNSGENSIKRISLKDTLNPVDEAINKAAKDNNQALVDRLFKMKQAITDNLETVIDAEGKPVIRSAGKANLESLSPAEAAKIKSRIGDMTQWTGNPSDDKAVNLVFKRIYGRIKGKINSVAPEVAPLNERYADLTSAEVAALRTENIQQRQNMVGLAPKIAGYGGIAASALTQDPTWLLTSLASFGIDKLMASPAAKTRIAKALSQMAESDVVKVISKYPQLQQFVGGKIEDLLKGKVQPNVQYNSNVPALPNLPKGVQQPQFAGGVDISSGVIEQPNQMGIGTIPLKQGSQSAPLALPAPKYGFTPQGKLTTSPEIAPLGLPYENISKGKLPYQYTREEVIQSLGKNANNITLKQQAILAHRSAIKKAIERGENVDLNVLKAYDDLYKKYSPLIQRRLAGNDEASRILRESRVGLSSPKNR